MIIAQPLAIADDHAFFINTINTLKKLCNSALQKCHASGDQFDTFHILFDDSSIYQISRIGEVCLDGNSL